MVALKWDSLIVSTRKTLHVDLGFAGYYRTFLPNYSVMTNWLNGIKKAPRFMWNSEVERDLEELKRPFTYSGLQRQCPPWIQTFPDFCSGNLCVLTTDWSKRRTSQKCSPRCRTDRRGSSNATKEACNKSKKN